MEKKADEDKVTVDAYHGTAEAYKDSILRTKNLKPVMRRMIGQEVEYISL